MLTLTSVKLVLRDLLDKRRPDLLLSKAGAYYETDLEEQLAAIEALPPALTGAPLAATLDTLNDTHDGFGAAIYLTTEVYLRLPSAIPSTVEAAQRIRAAFIPQMVELSASYAVQADRAIERKPLLVSMKKDLEHFPLANGGTLLDAAKGFLDAGEQIHYALSDRADVPKAARKQAAQLRSSAVGVLGRLRDDLVREIKKNPALPRDLEAKVFGYLDTLEAMQKDGKTSPPPGSPTGG
ncbi:hypothetical protein [Polyangium spumosum]|uniref:Uncharacterized protein n=1 Tax=Polyangium spumosum TaxID=889282 RepID=A0A6N7PMT0_9BACT|nr:hypothetical protein [Polyangium spumosum]MRG93318.1 hypothetical protein [Polyangium spumosum]